MRTIEVKAKTREEAIEKALAELHVERHEVAIEIIDEGSSGFLGLGKRDVHLRVTADKDEPEESRPVRGGREPHRPTQERPTQERPASGGREEGGRGRGSRRGSPEQQRNEVSASSGDRKEPREQERSNERRGNRQEKRTEERRPEQAPRGSRNRSNGNRNERREEPRREPAAQSTPEIRKPVEGEVTSVSMLLQELIREMGITATVTSHQNEEGAIVLAVQSEDSAILIGRKGRTLHALQYLINRMARNSGEDADVSERIVVDIEGYIERRRASLEEMALRLARRAKETGRRVRVKPLSPQERRMIHVALQDDPDVRTFSVGSAASRCVIIAPKDERPRRRVGSRPDNRYQENREEEEAAVAIVADELIEDEDIFDEDEDESDDEK